MTKKKDETLQQQIEELTADLQRVRADFENYRKRVEGEKQSAMSTGETKAIMKLLPVVDTIDRALANIPEDIADNPWVQGVAGLQKQLDKALSALDLARIEAGVDTPFDPSFHQAVQFDEDATGDTEVVAEELQAGYLYKGTPIRHAMVKATRK